MSLDPTVVIVPGLRDHVEQHWQTLLAARLPRVATVPPMGREQLDCLARVQALEDVVASIEGPFVLVAHSGGCITVAHWARRTRRVPLGALLATPPDFDRPMPEGYPTLEQLADAGWLPVPRAPLPFRTIVAASRNDPLATCERVEALAGDWGSRLLDLGAVGHLNPASGFGEWPMAEHLVGYLADLAIAA
ncbi:MAG TPA: alpha/beta hydrolase [Nevskiaceae bacterium]|nr:alpha/beta hydrolase [Nevskiaceae bacterium]